MNPNTVWFVNKRFLVVLMFIFSVIVFLPYFAFPRIQRTCADFSSQTEAKKKLIKEPKKYRRLDHNHDGKPCERLPEFDTPFLMY